MPRGQRGRFQRRLRALKPVSAPRTSSPVAPGSSGQYIIGRCVSMKWNILVGSLVLGASLCTPSFGGGLLDRLLSLKGAGCDTSCCDTTPACDPGCGVENACDPGCGIENPCEPACGVENACEPACGVEACNSGCAAAPSCGTEVACVKPRKKPLLSLLHSLKPKKLGCDNGCDPGCGIENACEPACGIENSACGCAAAPACGIEVPASCDNGCDSGCKIKRPRLLDVLFKCKSKGCDETCCDAISSCGCGTAAPAAPAAPAASEAAPMPPAPTTDHSAQLQSKRRVIQASSYVR
jgi:hypothetical protein